MPTSRAVVDFLDFVDSSPSPYHSVRSAVTRLEKAGFSKVSERDSWASTIRPGGKYYLTRNGSSLVAFAVGRKWLPGGPVGVVGTHTDSCALRLKPVSLRSSVGFLQVGVETYGGGLWHTWFDRDLSVAGRAIVRDGNGDFVSKLVTLEKPLLRIPTLAVHLDRTSGTEFKLNKETTLLPIAGLVAAELNKTAKPPKVAGDDGPQGGGGGTNEDFKPLKAMTERHHPRLLDMIAVNVGVKADDIIDFELVLHDTQPACVGGLDDEFIFASRIDNLGMTYCSVAGLIESVEENAALEDESSIRMSACFDHEEVGSVSAQGAGSSLLADVFRRLGALPRIRDDESYCHVTPTTPTSTSAEGSGSVFEQMIARSFLLSADMAHSVHPSYADKHERSHHPILNAGPVIKINANQRYASNSPGIVLVQECARLGGVPLQLFVVRNDSSCGSTIGPMLSAKLGLRTVDLGNPQLSMHSIRETGGSKDVDYGIELFRQFFKNYASLETRLVVD